MGLSAKLERNDFTGPKKKKKRKERNTIKKEDFVGLLKNHEEGLRHMELLLESHYS